MEELAERRFLAAQNPEVPTTNIPSSDELQFQVNALSEKTAFQDLFKKVAHADFSSYLAKLQVPIPPSYLIGSYLAKRDFSVLFTDNVAVKLQYPSSSMQ